MKTWLIAALVLTSLAFLIHVISGWMVGKGSAGNPNVQGGAPGNSLAQPAESFGAVLVGALFLLLRVYAIPLAIIGGLIWWSGVLKPGITFDEWSQRDGGWQELSDIKSGKYVLTAEGKNLISVAEKEGGTRLLEVLPDGFIPECGKVGKYPEPWNLPVPAGPPLGLVFKVGRGGQPFSYAKGVKVAIPGGKKLWVTINVPQDKNPNFCFNEGRVRIEAKKI